MHEILDGLKEINTKGKDSSERAVQDKVTAGFKSFNRLYIDGIKNDTNKLAGLDTGTGIISVVDNMLKYHTAAMNSIIHPTTEGIDSLAIKLAAEKKEREREAAKKLEAEEREKRLEEEKEREEREERERENARIKAEEDAKKAIQLKELEKRLHETPLETLMRENNYTAGTEYYAKWLEDNKDEVDETLKKQIRGILIDKNTVKERKNCMIYYHLLQHYSTKLMQTLPNETPAQQAVNEYMHRKLWGADRRLEQINIDRWNTQKNTKDEGDLFKSFSFGTQYMNRVFSIHSQLEADRPEDPFVQAMPQGSPARENLEKMIEETKRIFKSEFDRTILTKKVGVDKYNEKTCTAV